MGIGSTKDKFVAPPNDEELQQQIDTLFGELAQTNKIQLLNQPIIRISYNLSSQGSFKQQQKGFYANPGLLKCLYHPTFEKSLKNMVKLLVKELKNIFETKIIALVSRERFRKALNIADFCIYFLNQSTIQTVNLLSVRSDLDPETKELVNHYTKESPEINQQPLDSFDRQQLYEMVRMLRISICNMIDLHLSLFTRSDFTLETVDRLNQSAFVIYSKILFSQGKQIRKREAQQNGKNLLKLNSYFLGLGLEKKIASVYELAVIQLQSLFDNMGEDVKSQKALPSHLFKSLPIVSHNEMINWITNVLLFALQCEKYDFQMHSKLNVNRIFSFKLITLIFQRFKPHDHQITYLLEEICLQTKPFQIQRVYVSALASSYAQTGSATELIKKYAQLCNVAYNLKANNKEVKIKPEDVRTQLEDDDDSIKKEATDLCNKYTIHVVFRSSQVMYQYSDKALWNMILYQMEAEGQREKQIEEDFNKEGQEEEP